MNPFPPVFSTVFYSNDVQSGEHNFSLPQFCLSDGKIGFDFTQQNTSAKFSDDGKQWKRRGGVDKKLLHKVIEKERRKQMKSRYSDLRSIIPEENFRGKTSITDQLSVATDYIRHMEQKVEELAKKRDKMKMNEMQDCYKEDKDTSLLECKAFPQVNVNHVGSLVLVTTSSLRGDMALSRLLLALEEEGLHIISASSFTPDDKVFHSLQCKVFDKQKFTSAAKLEQRLRQLME
ncbi:hypothetical protein SUGI_1188520 [Cryptomeria japonica]|uniref:transcription factor bHLH36 n=1 Tax=Cryptomeria japonica TaxID=3369 RepID=UPI0024148185|nr:transcription factor bHLH36 [Cryptomeria japonica]GLJ55372.1 hypothetical protein SUGI_1188520 [Cryptomeria japonica]